MSLAKKLLASAGDAKKLYVDDVFSTYLYTGNGGAQTINNGIDLTGNGGLVWAKSRGSAFDNILTDTARGGGKCMFSNGAFNEANCGTSDISGFTSSGFTLLNAGGQVNTNGNSVVSWTFRRAPKFFDVVTYTGNGASSRAIAHALGIAPGMVISKTTSTTGDWNVYHRSATGDLKLNTTEVQTASRAIMNSADSSTFTVSGAANTNGVQYVAYAFAHDASADGLIIAGTYTGNGSATGPAVNLGFEPQWLMVKSVASTGSWQIVDSMRGMPVGSGEAVLQANVASAEATQEYVSPTATGFNVASSNSEVNSSGNTYIYLAIRRPNKPPKTGAEVFAPVARTGTGAAATVTGVGFAPDIVRSQERLGVGVNSCFFDRLRGAGAVLTQSNVSEAVDMSSLTSFGMDGVSLGADGSLYAGINYAPRSYINHFFRRAPGFMDVVCDTGTGAAHAVAHNLTVAPELMIRKSRSAATQWEVWHKALAASEKLVLNSTATKVTDATAWNSVAPGASSFTVGTGANVNAGFPFVSYLWATCPGVSKVGSYTGNGGTQNIDCGFTTGARFFLVKAIDAAGSWWIYDSARGITSSTDPALQLNSTAAEITSANAVAPLTTGIAVTQEATCSINASGVNYLFLAIA